MPISEEQRKRRKDKQDAVRREPRICGWCEEKADYPENNGQIFWKTPKGSRHMAICVKCYARLASEQVACVHCGKHVDGGDQVVCNACHDNQAREPVVCSACGEKIEGKRLLCHACFVKRNADGANSNEAPSPRTRSQQPQVKRYFRRIKDEG